MFDYFRYRRFSGHCIRPLPRHPNFYWLFYNFWFFLCRKRCIGCEIDWRTTYNSCLGLSKSWVWHQELRWNFYPVRYFWIWSYSEIVKDWDNKWCLCRIIRSQDDSQVYRYHRQWCNYRLHCYGYFRLHRYPLNCIFTTYTSIQWVCLRSNCINIDYWWLLDLNSDWLSCSRIWNNN